MGVIKSQYTQNVVNYFTTYALSKIGLSALAPIILIL